MLLGQPQPASAPASRPLPRLALGLTLLAIAAYLLIFLAGLPARWRELTHICRAEACLPLELTPADAEALANLGLSPGFYAGFHVSLEVLVVTLLLLLAGLIIWRRSDSGLALLTALALVAFGAAVITESEGALARAQPVLAWPIGVLETAGTLPFIWLLFTFPNGRLVPRWGWVSLLVVGLGLAVSAAFGPPMAYGNPTRPVMLVVFLLLIAVGVAAQVYRHGRVSTPIERQQTKWVMLGLVGIVVAMIVYLLFVELYPPPVGPARVGFYFAGMAGMAVPLVALPVSLAIAILRYRLWDIDLLIRRTLIYAVLTATLALVYFGAVVSLQSLLRLATGQEQSEIVVVLSTLLIAALFIPIRRRWQQAIDLRFYRQRYDAAQVLSQFGASLRDEVDLDPLVHRLVSTVDVTIQPESISLWLSDAPAEIPPSR